MITIRRPEGILPPRVESGGSKFFTYWAHHRRVGYSSKQADALNLGAVPHGSHSSKTHFGYDSRLAVHQWQVFVALFRASFADDDQAHYPWIEIAIFLLLHSLAGVLWFRRRAIWLRIFAGHNWFRDEADRWRSDVSSGLEVEVSLHFSREFRIAWIVS